MKEIKTAPTAYVPNHRPRRIQQLREELGALKRQYRKAGDVEKEGLSDLRAILRKDLLTLLRAENHRRRHRERARRRAGFLAIPFTLTRELLGLVT